MCGNTASLNFSEAHCFLFAHAAITLKMVFVESSNVVVPLLPGIVTKAAIPLPTSYRNGEIQWQTTLFHFIVPPSAVEEVRGSAAAFLEVAAG